MATRQKQFALSALAMALLAGACAHPKPAHGGRPPLSEAARDHIFRHAQVWRATDVAQMDIRQGDVGKNGFSEDETIACEFVPVKMGGKSPKFLCRIPPSDDLKVKFGANNGEVYGEVAATRLLWALGFGADRMFPVHVSCHGCPAAIGASSGERPHDRFVAVAAVERKMAGHDVVGPHGEGWSWRELDRVDEAAGGAPRAQRDALKLLAAVMQHTDSKAEQQRLLCQDASPSATGDCEKPFLMISDLGMTFGRATALNRDSPSSVNFERWSTTKVWRDAEHCVANLTKSLTGTLEDPRIGEAGRAFLSGLLVQLSDAQLHDLFAIAQFDKRVGGGRTATVDEWVAAFRAKRDEIVNARCR